MQWNNKYNYPKSTRSIFQGSRHYSVNKENLPSVTTILKATESEEKKAKLEEWKKRVGYKQAEAISKEATTRGSSMHDYLEKFLLGKLNLDLLGDNTREKMMADQIIENGLRHKLMRFGDVKQHYIIPESMRVPQIVLGFMKTKKPL